MTTQIFHYLNILLTPQEKTKMGFLAFLSVFVSLIEMGALILILPFIAIVSDNSLIETNRYLNYMYAFLDMKSYAVFINFIGFSLIALYIVRSVLNTVFLYEITKFSNQVVASVRKNLFYRDIKLLYTSFSTKNTSSLANTIIIEANNIYHIVFPILTIVSEGIIFVLLISLLLYQNFQVSSFLFLFFAIVSFAVLKYFKKYFGVQGKERAVLAEKNSRLISESFGNFKYIKLSNIENKISDQFTENSVKLANTNTLYLVLSALPRYIFETLGLIIIILAILYLYSIGSSVLSTIGLYVISFYRLLPSVNKIINSLNSIKFYEKSFDTIIENLSYPIEEDEKEKQDIAFDSQIELKDVSFSFGAKKLFDKVNLTINKNDKIAFVGESGSGKTTLVNILTTLIYDIEGQLLIDGVVVDQKNCEAWRKKIGYIPQDLYLFDGTVAENVVFGSGVYDESKIIEVLKIAKIYDFFLKKEGLDTLVGDNAIQLSGGQKQRLAIARALYGNPEILVLDEATSALDMATEEDIMRDIYEISINKTLFVIAHRLNTIQGCNRIIKMDNGALNEQL